MELRYCVPDALKLSNDPALKAAAEALIAAGPDAAAAGAAAAGGASSSSAAAASAERAAARGGVGQRAGLGGRQPERKRRGKAKASSASSSSALDLNDAPPKRPKVEQPPSNTADAPIDLT